MLGIIPAAGASSRIAPLAFAKELLPLGSRRDGEVERPRAVSEYLIDRLRGAGVDRICFIIGAGKSDILEYYSGGALAGTSAFFVVQPHPAGLCDAIFCATAMVRKEEVVAVGMPDTIWFPENGFSALPDDQLAFLLFPVEQPQFFDVVVTDEMNRVREIQVKPEEPRGHWIWGAFTMPGFLFHRLHRLWLERGKIDEHLGTLVNAYLINGGSAIGIRAGESYADVGTMDGYRQALRLFEERRQAEPKRSPLRRRAAAA